KIYVTSGITGKIKATGNVFVNTTGTPAAGTDTVFTPPYAYTLDKGSDVKSVVMNGAGAGKLAAVTVPQPSNYWKLDETTGATASDSVGGLNGKVINGKNADWVTGKIGRGLQFNGTNESVSLGNNLNVTKNFTIAAWIKPSKVTGIQGIFGKITG